MKNYIIICLLFCSSGLIAGSPAPPAIEGPSSVAIYGNTSGNVQAAFYLDISDDFAEYHDGFISSAWSSTAGMPLLMTNTSLTLDVNVFPINVSGGNITVSASSKYKDGFKHTAEFLCQVIKFSSFNAESEDIEETNASSSGETVNSNYAFLLFPNPSQGKFKLNLMLGETTDVEVRVIDLSGKEVFSAYDREMSGNYSKEIMLEDGKKGTYILKVKTDKINLSERIVLD